MESDLYQVANQVCGPVDDGVGFWYFVFFNYICVLLC